MKIIDNKTITKRMIEIPQGSVFRFNGEYYLKTKTMFLYEEMKEFSDENDMLIMAELEDSASNINAINLLDGRCYDFHHDVMVEELNVELHIV